MNDNWPTETVDTSDVATDRAKLRAYDPRPIFKPERNTRVLAVGKITPAEKTSNIYFGSYSQRRVTVRFVEGGEIFHSAWRLAVETK